MPFLNGNTFEHFLDAMSKDPQAAEVHNIIISDNAGAHHGKSLKVPENISLIFLPAYSPELNPAARVWEYMKERFGGKIFSDLDALSGHIERVISGLTNDIILSIASPEWVTKVLDAQLLT